MRKILWLAAWYPNRLGPFDGDFIQRHARAVSLRRQVRVIFVVRDKDGRVTKDVLEETVETGGLRETVIYYYVPGLPLIGRLLSVIKYHRLYRRAITAYLAQEGRPGCVHLHVAGKQALMAFWLQRRRGIPFVLTEHWTGYLPEAASPRPFPAARWIGRRVIKQAAGISVVSQWLGQALQGLQQETRFSVIPNVVDTRLFFPAPAGNPPERFHFIHISTLGHQKNPEAILTAFSLVKQVQLPFRLSVFGPKRPDLERMAATLGLQNDVSFYTEVPQEELAGHMRGADALILYSRYETFGCVLIEANACGLPALVSDIPVHHETITDGVNGYFVRGEDAVALADAIAKLVQQGPAANRDAIAAAAKERYSYERIAQLFDVFYDKAIGPGS